MKELIKFSAVSVSAFAFLAVSALAQQETPPAENAPRLQNPAAMEAPGWDASANLSYTARSTTTFQGNHLANSDAYSANFGVGRQIAFDEDWFAHVGLASDNIFLGTVAGAPIPAGIHTLHLNTGLGYRINDDWTISGLLFPTLYQLDQIGSGDFGLAGGALATYRSSPSLLWSFGVMVAPDSDVPALPIGSVRWKINDRSLLEVGLPKTRYTYWLERKWTVYAGADTVGTTFRTSPSLGTQTGLPQFNHALATYRDIRLGVGTGYELLPGLRAEVEAGYSVYRRVNYTRISESVDFDPAPYVRAGLNYRF